MTKKIIILIQILLPALFISMTEPVNAAVSLNLEAGPYFAGDAGTLWGGELAGLWNISPELAVNVSSSYFGSREDGGTAAETVKGICGLTAGVQYMYQVSTLPLYWTGTAAAGCSWYYEQGPKKYGPYSDPSVTETTDDPGIMFYAGTGILYHLSQILSLTCDIGYSQSFFFDNFKDSYTGGVRILAGVRFVISGENRSINNGW